MLLPEIDFVSWAFEAPALEPAAREGMWVSVSCSVPDSVSDLSRRSGYTVV